MSRSTFYSDQPPADKDSEESGHILMLVLILVTIASFAMAGALQFNVSQLKTEVAYNQRSVRTYDLEGALNQSLSWVRAMSPNYFSAFRKAEFYQKFDRTAMDPGSNQSALPVPSALKLHGTTLAPILTNDPGLGTSAFPSTVTLGGASFDAVSAFNAANFGTTKVRLTLIDALPDDPTGDTSPNPSTDFFPVFRVDAMTEIDRGLHVYGYIVGRLVSSSPVGFFGRESVNLTQDCDAFDSTFGPISATNLKPSCPVRSEGEVCIGSGSKVFGNVKTSGTITSGGTCSGTICTDLQCNSTAQACTGPGCKVGTFPTAPVLGSICTAGFNSGSLSVNNHSEVTLTAQPGNQCWSSVTVKNQGTLTLTSTSTPYIFNEFNLQGNLQILPDDPTKTVEIWVQSIDSTLNGNQVINSSASAARLRLVYWGSTELKLNGNAIFYLQLIAPLAQVTVLGNSDYFGSIAAHRLVATGNGDLHYDQALGSGTTTDIAFKLVNINHQYR